MKIPKVLFQTSVEPQSEHVLKMLRELAPKWTYKHFTDKEIIKYFIENPEPEFPFIVHRFHQMRFGAHKADLFRYYYLYQNGGVFLDSDAMIERPLDEIVLDFEFFSVKSYIEGTVFQGFLGCVPRHPILRAALKDAYSVDIDRLTREYHLLTANMWTFYSGGANAKTKLYRELESDGEKAVSIDDESSQILTHYWKNKSIPLKQI